MKTISLTLLLLIMYAVTFAQTDAKREFLLQNAESGLFEAQDYITARQQMSFQNQINTNSKTNSSELIWSDLGPNNLGGRVRAICSDNQIPGRIYCGSIGGGISISEDYGEHWHFANMDSIAYPVGCIAQASNGDLYAGTGEAFYYVDGIAHGGAGTPGNGILKSTDHGNTWMPLTATNYTGAVSTSNTWSYISCIAVNPSNALHVLAGTMNNGLWQSYDGGASWDSVFLSGVPSLVYRFINSVEFNCTGSILYVSSRGNMWRSNDNGVNFTKLTLIYIGAERSTIATSPSNPNRVSIMSVSNTGYFNSLITSTDAGQNWELNARSLPYTETGLGLYSQALSYIDSSKMYLGTNELALIDDTLTFELDTLDLLAKKIHSIEKDNFLRNTFYVGTDYGIMKITPFLTSDVQPPLARINQGLNNTMSFSLSSSLSGKLIAGAEDNGVIINTDPTGNYKNYEQVTKSFGTYPEYSVLNDKFSIATIRFAYSWSSANDWSTHRCIYDTLIDPDGNCSPGASSANNPFFAEALLVETKHAEKNLTQLVFVADRNYTSGESLTLYSHTDNVPFDVILESNLSLGDTAIFTDRVDSKFYINTQLILGSGLWMLKNPLMFSSPREWFKIDIPYLYNGTLSMNSSFDGDILYLGSYDNKLTKISGLNSTADYSNPPYILNLYIREINLPEIKPVCGIYVDDNDSNHVVITYGQFGSFSHVWKSIDGGNSFVDISSNLPQMPCYTVVIDHYNSSHYIIGSELGVWESYNAGASWQSAGQTVGGGTIGYTPVYRLRQRPNLDENCYVVYMATYGRGLYRSNNLNGDDCELALQLNTPVPGDIEVELFPNPSTESCLLQFSSGFQSDVQVEIYDLQSHLQKRLMAKGGQQSIFINTTDLVPGLYLVRISIDNQKNIVRKLVVQ